MKLNTFGLAAGLVALLNLGNLMANENPQVSIKTSNGTIVVELYADKSPTTVRNFLNLVDSDFYSGLIFHRVIARFMIQTGGFYENMRQKDSEHTIVNEASNGLSNLRGTLAMARTNDPDSASSQFFINVKDNTFLDKSEEDHGYAVFGKVISGMDVVEQIELSVTHSVGGHDDVPKEVTIIEDVSRIESNDQS